MTEVNNHVRQILPKSTEPNAVVKNDEGEIQIFDENCNLSDVYSSWGNGTAHEQYLYNKDNQLIRHSLDINSDNIPEEVLDIFYDEDGSVFAQQFYSNLVDDSKKTDFYTYDNNGNVVKVDTYVDEDLDDKYDYMYQTLYDTKTKKPVLVRRDDNLDFTFEDAQIIDDKSQKSANATGANKNKAQDVSQKPQRANVAKAQERLTDS